MKIITVVGTRPQFIKSAIVSKGFEKANIEEVIIHTGQHYDHNMSEIFFDELGILLPKINLCIGGGSHGQNTGRMIEALEKCLIDERPDCVLVYGDTDSTLAAALAAVKLKISIIHIEAGLRSFNKSMPEEINRIIVDHIAKLLFSPTHVAYNNLLREGIDEQQIVQCGDVMYDAALYYSYNAEQRSKILSRLGLASKSYILATIHRAESTNCKNNLENIFNGLSEGGKKIILPIHPRTKNFIIKSKIVIPSNIMVIDPVGYLDMLMLEKNAYLIITDSGGVQKEAFFFKVPCITLRLETEWIELVEGGFNKLVGYDRSLIKDSLNSKVNINFQSVNHIYGDGNAVNIIVDKIKQGL